MKQVFESVPINNPEVKRLLDNFLWMYEERDDIRKDVRQTSFDAVRKSHCNMRRAHTDA